jgi:quercetin dioxygenase-like cupin family protein
MINMNRRDLCVALSSFAVLSAAGQAGAQAPAASAPSAEPLLSQSRSYLFDQLPMKKSANGESRPVVSGVLPTGEAVEMHETTLLPGHMPHPPHKHRHSEFMLIREGTLEFDNDGNLERVGPGGVIFAASMVTHGVKNVGDTNANYFVIAIGQQSAG